MRLDERLRDRGPGAPVRPGGGRNGGLLLGLALLVLCSAALFGITRWQDRVAATPDRPDSADRPRQSPPSKDVGAPGKLMPAGSPQNWVSDDDYPPAALRRGQQGTVGFALHVDAGGRPERCEITSSSGTPALDSAACRLLMKRARFVPARDGTGKAIPATFRSRFTWRIPS